jgi:eukaryotic-like serine/threonine-protein kinase
MNELELFTEALLHSDGAQRAAYLDQACGADAALRERVAKLLALHERSHPLFERRPRELLEALESKTPFVDDTAGAPPVEPAAVQLAPFLAPGQRPGVLGRLGHYDVLEVLGQGGFGIVVKAFDDSLHRVVAIKVLAPHLATTLPPRKRFLREARAAARVKHENVVQIYAVEEQPIPYLVMEFVEGPTVQEQLDRVGLLEPAEVVRLGCQIARGLAAAHDRGLIHRDVKPANILLEGGVEPCAKLTDFGLARASDDARLTQSEVIAGTPMFMSPEQARCTALDPRADLFSLGSVLYTMTTGRPPFRAATAFAVLKRVVEDAPRPIREVIAGVPEGLCAVITRLLEKKPEARFATARAAAEALARCLTDRVPAPPTAPRRGGKMLAAAGVVLLLLIGAGWLVGRFASPSRETGRFLEVAQTTNQDGTLATRAVSPGPTEKVPPEGDPWESAVVRMNADDQIKAVVARLKELNPEFDQKSVSHETANGVVATVRVNNCHGLNDLTPLRALTGLKHLSLTGNGAADLSPLKGMKLVFFSSDGCPIKDLSPLAGMPLATVCLDHVATDDLSPLKGLKLVSAYVANSPVKDISAFKEMPLTALRLDNVPIEDLSPLEGKRLRSLECRYTKVTSIAPLTKSPLEFLLVQGSPIVDYSPLRTMPLTTLRLDYDPQRHAKLLRSIPTLATINDRPAAEVLGRDGQ